jgi:hypothetical protein
MDRDRRYFIASSSSLRKGTGYVRDDRWRQVDTSPDADAERVELTVDQPEACQHYYHACGKVDQHNRHWQATLKLVTKFVTHDWAKRVNLSIFGMCVVDAWLAFSQCTESKETQKDFYSLLADELIDHNYDNQRGGGRGLARSLQQNDDDASTVSELTTASGLPRCGVYSHLTPTKRKRRKKDGTTTRRLLQGQQCMECGLKCTYLCSDCVDEKATNDGTRENGDRGAWCCHTKNGKLCYPNHIHKVHNS